MIHLVLFTTNWEVSCLRKQRTLLKRPVNYLTGVSMRTVVQKFDIHRKIIHDELKHMYIRYRKTKRVSYYTAKQIEVVLTHA